MMVPVLRVLLIGLGVTLVAGCPRRTSPPPPVPTVTAEPEPEPEPEPVAEAELEPEREPEPCAGGRAWDGKPDGCTYEHAGCCYDSAGTACAAAGCSNDRCNVLESAPAQIVCQG